MGATLPAISRWVESTRTGLSELGLFYGANTFGAVLGSLLTGLFLLPLFDVSIATAVAVFINASVGIVALAFARFKAYEAPAFSEDHPSIPTTRRSIPVSIVLGLSGLTALGAEVIWTRLLGLLLGPTAYTFSIVLAVFLLGLGIGSSVGARMARRVTSAGRALAICQILLIVAIPYAALVIGHVIPRWLTWEPWNQSAWVRISLDVLRTMAALLPATCLWGASFPLGVAAALDGKMDNGRLVGRLYAANTLGAILGATGVSLMIVPTWGSQVAGQCLTCLAGCSGLLMLWSLRKTETTRKAPGVQFVQISVLAALCPVAVMLVPAVPKALLAYGHAVQFWGTIDSYQFVSEGIDSTVVIATSKMGNRCFHISGKCEATTSLIDMRTQRMLGHLPALSHKEPRTALVVGCGSGMTAGSLLLHPSIERVVICEMESAVIKAARENFAIQNYGVLKDPRTTIVIDDARHFLATTSEKFDIITTDPIHPWVKGAAALYTSEFFDLCRDHLNRGGVVAQWIPLYESNEPAVKCELATFIRAFPLATIWSGDSREKGYDVIAIGSEDASADPSQMTRRVAALPQVCQSLIEVEIDSGVTLQHMFAAHGSDLNEWLRDAAINNDCNLRLQYLAGLTPDGVVAQTMISKITGQLRDAENVSDRR